MSVLDGIQAILAGNAFANAFWVFVGVVAGALIQFGLGWLGQRSQRKYAIKALRTEIDLNLTQVQSFLERVSYLRERIAANQIQEQDLFISMQGFDYSIVNPLVMSGHFHVLLGPQNISNYFNFMRSFNDRNAEVINSMLRTEHENSRSLDYLRKVEEDCKRLTAGLISVRNSVSPRGHNRLQMAIAD